MALVTQCDQCKEITRSIYTSEWFELIALFVGFENMGVRRTAQLCSKECVIAYLGN